MGRACQAQRPDGRVGYRACSAERDAPRRRRSAARMQGADRVTETEHRKELA